MGSGTIRRAGTPTAEQIAAGARRARRRARGTPLCAEHPHPDTRYDQRGSCISRARTCTPRGPRTISDPRTRHRSSRLSRSHRRWYPNTSGSCRAERTGSVPAPGRQEPALRGTVAGGEHRIIPLVNVKRWRIGWQCARRPAKRASNRATAAPAQHAARIAGRTGAASPPPAHGNAIDETNRLESLAPPGDAGTRASAFSRAAVPSDDGCRDRRSAPQCAAWRDIQILMPAQAWPPRG